MFNILSKLTTAITGPNGPLNKSFDVSKTPFQLEMLFRKVDEEEENTEEQSMLSSNAASSRGSPFPTGNSPSHLKNTSQLVQTLFKHLYNNEQVSNLKVVLVNITQGTTNHQSHEIIHVNRAMLVAMSPVWRELVRNVQGKVKVCNEHTENLPDAQLLMRHNERDAEVFGESDMEVDRPPQEEESIREDAIPAAALEEEGDMSIPAEEGDGPLSDPEEATASSQDEKEKDKKKKVHELAQLQEMVISLREQVSSDLTVWNVPQQHAIEMGNVLQFIYGKRAHLVINAANWETLVSLSQQYGFPLVKQEAMEWAWDHIESLDWTSLFCWSLKMSETRLLVKVMAYMKPMEHLEPLMNVLGRESALRVLKSSNFLFSEEDFFRVLQKYKKKKRLSQEEWMQLMECVRLPQMSAEFLSDNIAPLVDKGIVPEKAYIQALCYHINPLQFLHAKDRRFCTRRKRFFVKAGSGHKIRILDHGRTILNTQHSAEAIIPISPCGVSRVSFRIIGEIMTNLIIGLSDFRQGYDTRNSLFLTNLSCGLNVFQPHYTYTYVVDFASDNLMIEQYDEEDGSLRTFTCFQKRKSSDFGRGICLKVIFSIGTACVLSIVDHTAAQ
mmetsp:Transcript_8517/g.31512  ORF Transcript_8517/g.31512 Transcript_8517/m.31512 type:complete len:611 (-) Transcript_8517:135-1967(-)